MKYQQSLILSDLLYRVFGKILRRGDHTKVAKDSEDSEEYTAMVFLNEFWRKNYYGEIYL